MADQTTGDEVKCVCPKTNCERRGRCRECVEYHRDVKKNLVFCLRAVAAGTK